MDHRNKVNPAVSTKAPMSMVQVHIMVVHTARTLMKAHKGLGHMAATLITTATTGLALTTAEAMIMAQRANPMMVDLIAVLQAILMTSNTAQMATNITMTNTKTVNIILVALKATSIITAIITMAGLQVGSTKTVSITTALPVASTTMAVLTMANTTIVSIIMAVTTMVRMVDHITEAQAMVTVTSIMMGPTTMVTNTKGRTAVTTIAALRAPALTKEALIVVTMVDLTMAVQMAPTMVAQVVHTMAAPVVHTMAAPVALTMEAQTALRMAGLIMAAVLLMATQTVALITVERTVVITTTMAPAALRTMADLTLVPQEVLDLIHLPQRRKVYSHLSGPLAQSHLQIQANRKAQASRRLMQAPLALGTRAARPDMRIPLQAHLRTAQLLTSPVQRHLQERAQFIPPILMALAQSPTVLERLHHQSTLAPVLYLMVLALLHRRHILAPAQRQHINLQALASPQ